MILWGLKNLSEESELTVQKTRNISYPDEKNTEWNRSGQREFTLSDLQEKWVLFCNRVKENNNTFAGFFSMVSGLEVKASSLILYLRDPFMQNGPICRRTEQESPMCSVLTSFFRLISALRSLQIQRNRKIC